MKLFAGKTRDTRHMVVLAAMAGGFSTVELITNNLIPLTCRHFTDNAFIIAAILASNRLFGFVVQPYVCWKSDYINTRFGRRRPFFLVGLPLTIISMLAVGLLPVLITGDARHTIGALAVVVIANIFMQAVVDVNWGSLEPLYADTFNQEQLGRASSIRQIATQSANFLMVTWVLGWADKNELYPYAFAACCVFASLMLMIFVIREKPLTAPPPPARYRPIAHLSLLFRSRDHLKLAFVCGANLVLPAALFLFTPLYVTDTLGLSKGELGLAQVAGPFLTIGLAFPVGILVDTYGPKGVMAAGFGCYAIAFAGLAFWVQGFWSLFACMTFFGVAQVVALMPMTAMVFQYAGQSERGQLFGIIQFTRAFSAFAISLILGTAVQSFDSYDPTPFRSPDVKDVDGFAQRLTQPAQPLEHYVAAHLSGRTLSLLATPESDPAAARVALTADLNRVVFGSSLSGATSLEGIALSAQSQKLLDRAPTVGDDLAVLNRSLLQDLFPVELSRKINYRLPYFIGLGLALFAIGVALATRRGQFARTLHDTPAPDAA